MDFFLQGLVIGFSIAAPVGPIGLICIRRSLAEGVMLGFTCGLGAATADAVYGTIAGMGLAFVSDALMAYQTWLRFLGGLFLGWLGLRIFLSKRPPGNTPADATSFAGAFASTFMLTLTNPMTILSFTGIFAALGVGTGGNYVSAGSLVLGVFVGSATWWLMLSGTVGLIRSTLNDKAFVWINRIAGTILICFGIAALINVTINYIQANQSLK